MRKRLFLIIAIAFLIAFYVGVNLAEIWPAHPLGMMAISFFIVFLFIGWQWSYRSSSFSQGPWSLFIAWTANIGIGVWVTFLFFAALKDVVILALPRRFLPLVPWSDVIFGLLATSVVLALIGGWQALTGPFIRQVAVPVKGLPKSLEGLKILQISDLHVGPTIRRAYVEKTVERSLSLNPDLIALTGDIFDGVFEVLAPHLEPLGRLRAPLGLFYVTGNHEYFWGAGMWTQKAVEYGLTPLNNENRILTFRGEKFLIAGIPDEMSRFFDQGNNPDCVKAAATQEGEMFKILLAHRPGVYAEAAAAGFNLQLSGHTHGGQFFPWSLVIRFFHRYYRGLNRYNHLWIYVSPGTGYWGPAQRLAVPAELTLLTLTGR